MTRIFTDGAEGGHTLNWDSSNLENVTNTVRIGGRSYRLTGTNHYADKNMPAGTSEIFGRFALWLEFSYFSQGRISFYDSLDNVIGFLHINTLGKIELYVNGVLIATRSTPLIVDTWYVIEYHVKIASSGGIVEYKVDGVMADTFTGNTQPGASTTIGKIRFSHHGGANIRYHLDDLAINTASGAADLSWCGDAHIYALPPNGNGDSSQFTGSDGNSTDNYLLVDEIPHNSDSDYVFSATSGHKDLYQVTNLPTLPVGSLVKRVIVEAHAREASADGDAINLGVKSGLTEAWSDNLPVGTSYSPKQAEFAVNPDTSLPWTESEINSMQVGIKIV